VITPTLSREDIFIGRGARHTFMVDTGEPGQINVVLDGSDEEVLRQVPAVWTHPNRFTPTVAAPSESGSA